MSTSLKTLITKLNGSARMATQRAANLCLANGHYEVDLEHLFLALLEQTDNDLARVLRANRISATAIQSDLEREIQTFKNGNTRTPVFSQHLQQLFQQAWLLASLDAHVAQIRSGHLLLALLTEPDLAQLAQRGSPLFAKIRLEDLKHDFDKLTDGSSEAAEAGASGGAAAEGDAQQAPADALAAGVPGKTPALDQFTTNLTQRARDGALDPVIGRDTEIRQVIDILMRRRQNNPILTGEAGVGKTAVVEGLALRIAAEDVPESLRAVALHTLDMGLLQAGASVKGEFENRLKNVIAEVKKSPHPIVLFIDEAHTMIGAGGQAGQSDAANLLKPALARGELRTIAATTWGEYKKYFEKDAALARRFQVVKVEEPSETLAAAMLRGMVPLMEKHFNIRVLDEAITEAVRLSHRYISGRQLPDKAVSVLDTACAKVALGQSATPALIEEANRGLERIEAESAALVRDTAAGGRHEARLAELAEKKSTLQAELAASQQRLTEENALVERIRALRAQRDESAVQPEAAPAEKAPARAASRKKTATTADPERDQLDALLAELRALQGTTPMVPLQVDGHVVAEIVSAWTGVPLGRMVKDEIKTVRALDTLLAERVIGQDHALAAVAQRVRTASARLEDPNKPRGVFMFVGPSGVGKTETALALADILYGGEKKLITINMSEYQEAHSVSGLKGSPPGYVGYGEGGVLTEAVRRQPYSVVLLDEVEKAHPDVLEMFFQVFDKGMMDDAEGREIDFRNTLIILTSNIGSSQIMQACLNKADDERPAPDALADALRPVLMKAFKPAFLGRMKVAPFYPITDAVLEQIIALKLGRIRDRIGTNHKAVFEWDDALVEAVLARCTEVDSGARNVDHILNGTLLPEIAEAVLTRMADETPLAKIKASCAKSGEFRYRIS
ncbi:type VI secretion system protein VasG [Variovorax boronicumulans]|uniref:Type VI secretion system protein VasG n=1 Tax=Variovorax boronicumulans TaxID=436515 RepID=A0AAW8D0H1_9BURK|nr:type VI secretion system ATPase TssH [Variovorax boronicumulans]MDP9894645.1 type VI secretion system protein VasG [Variovorax boronicumulans]MDQ0054464.1 type VI secretion system protein VasG [Variovorax boronicumulans]